MNQLITVRSNIFYTKNKGEYKKAIELIFLTANLNYALTNDDDIIRQREIKDFRISIPESEFDKLIGILTKLKEAKEEDLT